MTKLTESQKVDLFAEGIDALMCIARQLEPGQHLVGCQVELPAGTVPARVLIEVTGPTLDDIVTMDISQMHTFATVLGAGLMNPATARCEVHMHSTTPNAPAVQQAWERAPYAGSLRPLSAEETRQRYAPEPGTQTAPIFRSAFPISTDTHTA
jgi:hypothetical protein